MVDIWKPENKRQMGNGLLVVVSLPMRKIRSFTRLTRASKQRTNPGTTTLCNTTRYQFIIWAHQSEVVFFRSLFNCIFWLLSYNNAQREFIRDKANFNNDTDNPGAKFCDLNRLFLQSAAPSAIIYRASKTADEDPLGRIVGNQVSSSRSTQCSGIEENPDQY